MKNFIFLIFMLSGYWLYAQPAQSAPTPSQDSSFVISLFSDAYDDVLVDTWRTPWSSATLTDVEIEGNATKEYSNLDFVGIETIANQLDITGMTHVHMDVWSADFTLFGVKLVDFGADGAFGGGDDVEHQVDIDMPAQGEWVSLDIPLSAFVGLTTRQNIAQYILVGRPVGTNTVYVDNFYFYNDQGGATEPTAAAPTPTRDASDVISMFSDAYEDVVVDTWRTPWSSAVLEDVEIAGNATKKYSNLDFVGIETIANQLDITGMTHVHMDVWSADFTLFGVKLVDFGADGAFGGGDDVEHQVDIDMPAQGEWVSLDIPLSAFVGLTTRQNIAQYILVGRPVGTNTVYVDNFYFYNDLSNSTRSLDLDMTIQLYPNPVKRGQSVQFTKEINRIEVMDFAGKMIGTSNNTMLSTTGLNAGIYLVKMYTNDQKVGIRKLQIVD